MHGAKTTETMELTNEQIKAFRQVWFIYGNNGKKCTMFNHKLIQGFIEFNEDRRADYRGGYDNMAERFGKQYAKKTAATTECFKICRLILEGKMDEAIKIATNK